MLDSGTQGHGAESGFGPWWSASDHIAELGRGGQAGYPELATVPLGRTLPPLMTVSKAPQKVLASPAHTCPYLGARCSLPER